MSSFPGRPGSCRSCGASIRWATTERGKAIPLDPDPCEDGNVEFTGVGDIVRVLAGGADLFDGAPPRFMPHHATCPQASEWRRNKSKAHR